VRAAALRPHLTDDGAGPIGFPHPAGHDVAIALPARARFAGHRRIDPRKGCSMTTKRSITGARYGVRDWLAQRLSAVIMALYTIYLLISVLSTPRLDYTAWYRLFLSPFMKVATLVALLALVYHAWVGMREVYMDYARATWLRLTLQTGTIVLLVGYASWAVIILWRA
jgi:succinate dehydrogenase / fumarate reductase membrane anchor subunit